MAERRTEALVPLADFIKVEDPHLRSALYDTRRELGSGSAAPMATGDYKRLCGAIYEVVRRYDWLYDFEPGYADYSRQRIRTPREM
ncbi:MAG: hypothetical protein HC870_00405 [Rhizobiales bacterium]|nr:hypothetical protein [Hyphomicrobiales bacterium]